ncbi:Brix domain-containing protein [Sulfolobus sp. S-194]|uniref:Brix domain-containing protein n=1 Tax=Sulfolobus sp. S-194 TaxID=2512240 RepID=UPI00143C274C|nr:Brix domain-containing protein [Sulfolobus sp. S-194]
MLSGQVLHIHRIEIVFTSSRDAPLRVRTFLNELTYVFPNSIKINRGRQSLKDIIAKSTYLNSKYLVIIDVIKGNPGRFRVYDLASKILKYNFTIYGVTLLTELKLHRTLIKRGCIGKIEDQKIKNMLIDLGYIYIENCDVYANGDYITKDNNYVFELKFTKDDKILGPVIRFQLYDRNKNID